MSGHSKWSSIKHQKGIEDHKKSKVFGTLARQITLAVRQHGGITDPNMNPALRQALDDAKKENLPKENVQRATNKGAGIGAEGAIVSFQLEGYGPGGVAVLIEVESDNRNRTVSDIRHIFSEFSGSLGEPGSAAYVFGSDPNNPTYKTPVVDANDLGQLHGLFEELEAHEDVSNIFHNLQE